jgi:hypothetical protein
VDQFDFMGARTLVSGRATKIARTVQVSHGWTEGYAFLQSACSIDSTGTNICIENVHR